jgi:hypothetical protein
MGATCNARLTVLDLLTLGLRYKEHILSLIQKKRYTTQFLWVTIDPTYKLITGKLSVQYALFTYASICSFWFFNSEY